MYIPSVEHSPGNLYTLNGEASLTQSSMLPERNKSKATPLTIHCEDRHRIYNNAGSTTQG